MQIAAVRRYVGAPVPLRARRAGTNNRKYLAERPNQEGEGARAGETTVFNLLTRFLSATRGAILYKGDDITGARPADVARRGMVRSFQVSAVFPDLTAKENVRVALQRKLGTSFHFWRPESSLEVLDGRAEELLDAVGLLDQKDVTTVELPYGRKRALELATDVVHRRAELDGHIQRAAERWRLERLSVIDRNVLRLAVYELLETETPVKVVINEAIELGKKYGSESSGAFVNGVLDKVAAGLPAERGLGAR